MAICGLSPGAVQPARFGNRGEAMESDQLEYCQAVAREAGELLRAMQPQVTAREKGPADLVTQADTAAQRLIFERLQGRFPQYAFLGEEDLGDGAAALTPEQPTWVVDPLDGTTNYVHGLDNYAVSIALCRSDRAELGVVFDPVRQECYSAERGKGAWLNGRPIHPSRIEHLAQALVATSFPARVRPESPEVARFLAVLYQAQSVRRMGSAALNLAYVASGRLDGYWATSVKIWDIAAGALLVEESGGTMTGITGQPFTLADPRFVAAATSALQGELLQAIDSAGSMD
jgi:myo-inositol-1(or 4)-monophosphatase